MQPLHPSVPWSRRVSSGEVCDSRAEVLGFEQLDARAPFEDEVHDLIGVGRLEFEEPHFAFGIMCFRRDARQVHAEGGWGISPRLREQRQLATLLRHCRDEGMELCTNHTRAMGFRSILYTLAKHLGDVNAVRRGRIARRVGRRVAGRVAGKQVFRRIFK
ncbi:MAG: hypothetical protein JJU00_19060 [Opitutales bacterium]|nr:hypothetical protein [Opitutales bacterium]